MRLASGFLKTVPVFALLSWFVSPCFSGDVEGLIRIFASFKGQENFDFNADGDLDAAATYEGFDGNIAFTEMSLLENQQTP